MNMEQRLRIPLALLGAAMLLLGGCASSGSQPRTTLDEIHDALKEDGRPAAASANGARLPAGVNDALLPSIQLNTPAANVTATEPRFDVKVRRATARDFFLGLVEGTRYNMVVHPSVRGYISLDMKNVTVPEVMATVRDTYGYDFERDGNNFRVLPNTMQTRIFHINYLDIKRTGKSTISAGATQINRSRSTGNNGSNGTNNNNANNEGATSTSETSSITTDSKSDFWAGLEASLRTIVGTEDGRSVSVNAESGIVMVKAMPGELREVENYLDATQNVAQRQVILEARILEVELADGFQSGINWSSLTTAHAGSLVLGQVGGGSLLSGTGVASTNGTALTLAPPQSTITAGTATTAFGGMFTAAFTGNNFTAFVELLKSQGNVQVLSSPRISTVNNQKAVIKVGSDEFFVTNVNTTTTTTATAAVPNVSVELTPFFSGVSLDVTPQISDDGEITLHVRPSVSEVREQTKNISVTTFDMSIPLASSTVRESDSIIRAKNGQIVVIGGLMQNNTRDEQASVPVLGDIPILGALFRHTRQTKTKSELVILIKPTVVENDRQWSDALRHSAARYHQFDEQ